MKKILSVCIAINSLGQNIYFPKVNYYGSILLAKTIPILAKEVIRGYMNPDKSKYWDNLFRYQIVAKEYGLAKRSIDSLRKSFMSGDLESLFVRGIHYESYSVTKELQIEDTSAFEKLYITTLNKLYNALPEKAKASVEMYFLCRGRR